MSDSEHNADRVTGATGTDGTDGSNAGPRLPWRLRRRASALGIDHFHAVVEQRALGGDVGRLERAAAQRAFLDLRRSLIGEALLESERLYDSGVEHVAALVDEAIRDPVRRPREEEIPAWLDTVG